METLGLTVSSETTLCKHLKLTAPKRCEPLPCPFRRGIIAQRLQYQLKNRLLILLEIIFWRGQYFFSYPV